MGKHIIPQYYLRGFSSDPEQQHIYRSEKHTVKIKELPIKVVAQSKNYYTDEIEHYLAEEIESKTNPILEKLRNTSDYNYSDKEILAKYLCIMAQRVEKHKERIDRFKPEVIGTFFPKHKRALQSLILKHPDRRSILEEELEKWEKMHREFDIEVPKDIDQKAKEPILREAIVEHFIKMKWRLIYSYEQEYITSDNPLFFFESAGIANDISEVTFPITKNIAIFMTNENGKDEIVREISQRVIREINKRTVYFASRYVYSSKKYHWLESMILKKHHKINRILHN